MDKEFLRKLLTMIVEDIAILSEDPEGHKRSYRCYKQSSGKIEVFVSGNKDVDLPDDCKVVQVASIEQIERAISMAWGFISRFIRK